MIVDESRLRARSRVDRWRILVVTRLDRRRSIPFPPTRDPGPGFAARIGGCSYVNANRLEGVLQCGVTDPAGVVAFASARG
jgi:hypothetical protein